MLFSNSDDMVITGNNPQIEKKDTQKVESAALLVDVYEVIYISVDHALMSQILLNLTNLSSSHGVCLPKYAFLSTKKVTAETKNFYNVRNIHVSIVKTHTFTGMKKLMLKLSCATERI